MDAWPGASGATLRPLRQARRRELRRDGLLSLGPIVVALALSTVAAPGTTRLRADETESVPRYAADVLGDSPAAYWRLDRASVRLASGAEERPGDVRRAKFDAAGPQPAIFPAFESRNHAGRFESAGARLVFADTGEASVFDFGLGESLTLEAWVNPFSIGSGQNVYVIGKGRTANAGFAAENQNWALRLRGVDGECRVSFLFRDADNRPRSHPETGRDWHRWTSSSGFTPTSGWHHIAVSYTFGVPESLRSVIDGGAVEGAWDMGGASAEAPVVDDDEVWIGSSLGGAAGSSFHGLIDEIALYRRAVPVEALRSRFRVDEKAASAARAGAERVLRMEAPESTVLVELLEGAVRARSWHLDPVRARVSERFERPRLAFAALPKRYSESGFVVDRSAPFLVRAGSTIELPAGRYRFLLRALNGARLSIDDREVLVTRFLRPNADGHEEVPDIPEGEHPALRALPPGHAERVVEVELTAGAHVFRLDAHVGGSNLRPEIGELVVAFKSAEDDAAPFRMLAPDPQMRLELDESAWLAHAAGELEFARGRDRAMRRSQSASDDAYWRRRHQLAHTFVASLDPLAAPRAAPGAEVNGEIDLFVSRRLESAGREPRPITSDLEFLRRLSLDVRGVVPSLGEIEAFLADGHPGKRRRAIDRMLESPRWADHWVAYWQDVLAENPGILKPKLNNTGPFRWWIHEAFSDNMPIDRFVTSLIMMQGSRYGGAPAGFAMATQNDVPMAAKAHILGTAFVGVQMKCARCHDAPSHDLDQRDLFSIAAMLQRSTLAVPATSSVPRSAEELERMIIEVSLSPGEKIAPAWPFPKVVSAEGVEPLLRRPDDARERLAAILTGPRNTRFTRVIANRLWKRYMGWGIVEPVDDWELATPSHPELLDFLARELVRSGYDLKALARLILNSRTYQRAPAPSGREAPEPESRLFAGPRRRRMSAEQLVDSLFALAGKQFGTEALNLDVDARRPVTAFLNLGAPRRAWEFASLSNERDRPALSLPVAQSILDVLKEFGWRESRQDPITEREELATVLQPLTLANSVVAARIATLSDDSSLTRLALEAESVDGLVRALSLAVLGREPRGAELSLFGELLRDGFTSRVRKGAARTGSTKAVKHAVSWSNHLSAEATRIKLELERATLRGDTPTQSLAADWRERAEDVIWAMLNSPEFLFLP